MGFKICIQTVLLFTSLAVSPAAVLDRIAVTVGNDAITESEVMEEIRITSLLNNEPLDFSAPARRAAAERLVDQYLIRQELAGGGQVAPRWPDVAARLDRQRAHARIGRQPAVNGPARHHDVVPRTRGDRAIDGLEYRRPAGDVDGLVAD